MVVAGGVASQAHETALGAAAGGQPEGVGDLLPGGPAPAGGPGEVTLQGAQHRPRPVELGERGEDVVGRHLGLLAVVEAVAVGGRVSGDRGRAVVVGLLLSAARPACGGLEGAGNRSAGFSSSLA
ncbi:hypothetical protein [Streptomyces achromogenes]|uniref:hypothetical protein n=1 Tax=Streptomyces achromogenes TaxID=67255 RepID=UPI003448E966